jgi:hypothetical protein
MNDQRMARWLGPLALGFLVCVALGFFVLGSTSSPDQNASPSTIVSYYSAHYARELATIYVIGVGLGLLTFFVSGLRIALRAASGGHSWLPTTAFVGGLLYIGGFAIDGLIHFALLEAGYNHRADVANTVNFISNFSQVPVFLGLTVMALATGICILAGSTLPAWLGWLSIVVGAVTLAGDAGFFGFIASPIWMTILGFTIAHRATAERTALAGEAEAAPVTARAHRRLIPKH